MTTHYIYHIYGYKVGCTKNLEGRIGDYRRKGYTREDFEVLEVLPNSTPEEAGDREDWWNDRLGYRRYVPYAYTVAARLIGRNRITMAQKIEYGRKGGIRTTELGLSGYQNLTKEERIEAGRKSAATRQALGVDSPFKHFTMEQRIEYGHRGVIKDRCPHCGMESNRAILHRWHFDKCPHKPKIKWIYTRSSFSSRAELHL